MHNIVLLSINDVHVYSLKQLTVNSQHGQVGAPYHIQVDFLVKRTRPTYQFSGNTAQHYILTIMYIIAVHNIIGKCDVVLAFSVVMSARFPLNGNIFSEE